MRDYKLYLEDTVEAINRIEEYIQNLTFEDFSKNKLVLDAVVRNLEIIGEACRSIPEDIRRRYPDVEWKKIVGLRNILIHQYFGIDTELIWDIVKNKLPDLKHKVKQMLNDL